MLIFCLYEGGSILISFSLYLVEFIFILFLIKSLNCSGAITFLHLIFSHIFIKLFKINKAFPILPSPPYIVSKEVIFFSFI